MRDVPGDFALHTTTRRLAGWTSAASQVESDAPTPAPSRAAGGIPGAWGAALVGRAGLPASTPSEAALYYETVRDEAIPPYLLDRIEAPTAVADFPKEIYRAPRDWGERRADLVRWTEMPRGGHFAALEAPDLLLEDVRAFFRSLRARPAP